MALEAGETGDQARRPVIKKIYRALGMQQEIRVWASRLISRLCVALSVSFSVWPLLRWT